MAKKDEKVKRLQELAVILGREPDISGSAAEISQRVKEWEEEAGSQSETASEISPTENVNTDETDSSDKPQAGMVMVRALCTLHIDALSPDSDRTLELVKKGDLVRIPAGLLDEMIEDGLVDRA
ncbi:DNA breaking-rejoining protein [Salmonella enterica subsp. enterica serovar Eastbourne]|nr:DNA breaking-rejoining protein [Salmonella enterica subsp. enterica serovar Eastbourne]EHC5910635.1 DNA breaking-rejoining protein [Salmonella enterica subsp. enterica serovar Eastbourne]